MLLPFLTFSNFQGILVRKCSIGNAYIARLERLDREWTFRFMDLPPEMRNLVIYSIRLELVICCHCDRDEHSYEHSADFSLPKFFTSAFVERAQSLRKLTLVMPVSTAMKFTTQQFLDWFDPLTQLSPGVALELYGFDRETRDELKRRIEDAKPKVDVDVDADE
ncbi:uncharacterized protein MYCFIDRAFT_197783 [Pseudocercospora fijiensis CIRAD86]|uniref:Uncharacterized protein n=1 Tax=Pseudocercospora fijiensis (strain CIRAD86) TaxID=383855 RepID=M3ATU9_PSEFD|nr:uncharacterized protein MYCFIDRAFT_197783 [Pseudocercospora fijiensis CIRAD86]EME80912.1 hypothetical protein MYCFIDRAFT_197783 [Pseudocercospora fijiensis CIRAD86]